MWSSACAASLGSSPLLPTNHRDSPRRVPPPAPTVNHKNEKVTPLPQPGPTAPLYIDRTTSNATTCGVRMGVNRTTVWWGDVGRIYERDALPTLPARGREPLRRRKGAWTFRGGGKVGHSPQRRR